MKAWNDDLFYWKGLDSPQQVPRYLEIAHLIAQLCPQGSVLDVGCGEGLLRGFLDQETAYFGIEGSPAAAQSARRGEDAILQCTAEDFNGGGRKWNCVVFNEMLYYTRDP